MNINVHVYIAFTMLFTTPCIAEQHYTQYPKNITVHNNSSFMPLEQEKLEQTESSKIVLNQEQVDGERNTHPILDGALRVLSQAQDVQIN